MSIRNDIEWLIYNLSFRPLFTRSPKALAPSRHSSLPGITLQRSNQPTTFGYLLKSAPTSCKRKLFLRPISMFENHWITNYISDDWLTTMLATELKREISATDGFSVAATYSWPSKNVFNHSTASNNFWRWSSLIRVSPW